jgi:hypothetical protein
MPEIIGRDDGEENPAPVSPAVTALGRSLSDLVAESQALRSDVQVAEQARRRATVVNLALLGLLVLFVALLGAVSWQNNRLIEQVEKTNSTMADCTTPGGRCYEEGSRRTSGAINDIVWASVYMAQCSRLYPGEVGPAYDRKLEACVTERLQQAAEGRQNQPPPSTPSPSPTGGG